MKALATLATRALLGLLPAALLPAGCAAAQGDDTTGAGTRLTHLPAEGALGPYSAAVLTEELCFVSGKIGGAESRGADFATELAGALDALQGELDRAGLALADVVSVTVYLTDMSFYPELNSVYGSRFTPPWPARTCVAVAALPAGARVELAAVARRR